MGRPQSAIVFHAYLLVGAIVFNHATVHADRSDVHVDSPIRAGEPTQTDNMNYLMSTLNKFKSFAEKGKYAIEERHKGEEARLQGAMQQTQDAGVSLALQQSVTSNAQSLLETQRVYTNMVNFASSMEKFFQKATSSGSACESTTCGTYSSCTDTTLGAQCVCNEGYIGTGKDCSAPPEFMPHQLLFEGPGSKQTQARDLHVSLFGKNNIAVVFADVSRAGAGRFVVGNVREAGMATLSPPVSFTQVGSEAFSPVVAGTDNRRLIVAWRDKNTKGLCWMRSGALGTTNIRGAENHIKWGEPQNFCQSQSHKMAILALPGDRAVVFFTDQVAATQHTPAESFGNSMLLQLDNSGTMSSLGTFRFSDYPICRLDVTKLTPRTFVIAGRAGQAVNEMDSSVHTNQEAMALFGELTGTDLVYDPNPVNLEPTGKNIWARGVSLIAPNTFAYAYQRGDDSKMMLAVVEVNETNRERLQVVHQPTQIRTGFSPYISMLSVPYTASDPHTLTYYEGDKGSMINVCSWNAARGILNKCEDFMWVQGKVKSVSGVHLGGGKSFMVFAPESGVPYYGVFGLSKK